MKKKSQSLHVQPAARIHAAPMIILLMSLPDCYQITYRMNIEINERVKYIDNDHHRPPDVSAFQCMQVWRVKCNVSDYAAVETRQRTGVGRKSSLN